MDRPRKRLHRRETYLEPRFLTFSCYHRLPFLSNPIIADEFAHALERARSRRGFRLIAWVAMPEHVHFLLIPRPREVDIRVEVSVSGLLSAIKRPVAATVLTRWREAGWTGPAGVFAKTEPVFWQPGGGFDRNVRDGGEFVQTVEYIHQNPVKRGLVKEPTEYRWSSARAYAGIDYGLVKVDRVRWGEPWNWKADTTETG